VLGHKQTCGRETSVIQPWSEAAAAHIITIISNVCIAGIVCFGRALCNNVKVHIIVIIFTIIGGVTIAYDVVFWQPISQSTHGRSGGT